MKNPNVRKVLLAAGLLAVAGALFVLLTGGGGRADTEKKAFIEEFLREGNQVEAQVQKRFPADEVRRSNAFRESLEKLRQRLLTKYEMSDEEAESVFREARRKGWW